MRFQSRANKMSFVNVVLQEQQSESLQDLSTLDKDYLGLTASLSKSLTNLTDKRDNKGQDNKHKYERFSYSKQISSRRNAKSRSKDLKDTAGGGTLARENTFASSYISQDSHKKQYAEKRDQPHKDVHTERYKELRKIYGSKIDKDKKEKDKTEPKEKDKTESKEKDKTESKERDRIEPKETARKEQEKVKEKAAPNKSELQSLEQSGIYQIDFSSIRNEIPPVADAASLPPLSAKTERSYRGGRQPSRERTSINLPEGSRFGPRTRVVTKKWRDDCDCLRCSIIKRQFMEGDAAYMMWGNYPCRKVLKSRNSSEMYYYDSD